jgi:pimeloyl-ACP methyl ester carboxylesterase
MTHSSHWHHGSSAPSNPTGRRPLGRFARFAATPAWRTVPAWFLVASDDHAIDPAAERFMAQRVGATTVEINSSHVAMVSHPGKVTNLIEAAASATA